jgi:hypothetical protein
VAATNGIATGKNYAVSGNCKNFAFINCDPAKPGGTDFYGVEYSDKTIIQNGLYTTTVSLLVNAAYGPVTVNGTIGMYFIDASGSSIPITFDDPSLYKDCRIIFERMDSSVNSITFNAYGTELLDYLAMPQLNLLTHKGDTITVTSDGVDWFIISSSHPLKQERKLSTVTGIDAKVVAVTNLYTVPTGVTAIITKAIIRASVATAITQRPVLGIGIAAGEGDIYASTALTGFTALTSVWAFQSSNTFRNAVAASIIKLGIDNGSNGTTHTIEIDLFGFLL